MRKKKKKIEDGKSATDASNRLPRRSRDLNSQMEPIRWILGSSSDA